MMYCSTSDIFYTHGTRIFPCSVLTSRCTFVSALKNGLTRNQWNETIDKTYDPTLHNMTSWENIERMLETYTFFV